MNYDDENPDDPQYDEYHDVDRYDTAAGWQPVDPYQKQREKVREQMHRDFNPESMLQTLPANEWRFRRRENAAPPRPLYSDVWFEGETAVLIGPKSSNKSVLAVQLGQDIARGPNIVHSALNTVHSPPVLYIDCQRSRAQWQERYSSLLSPYDTRRVHHRFPRNFRRAALDWDGTVPDEFHGDLGKFLQYSIMQEIDRSGAKVVILDDLTTFCGGSTTPLAVTKALRMLKLLSVTETLSILALHSVSSPLVSKGRVCRSPHESKGTRDHEGRISLPNTRTSSRSSQRPLDSAPHVYDAADTVFTIAPSTFAPDIRYVKHLTSQRPITHDHTNVLTYRLERTSGNAGTPACNASPREADPSPAPEPTESTEQQRSSSVPSLIPHPSSLSEGPFLGLTSLGPSEERDHLRDYAAEAAQAQLAHERSLRRLWKRSSKDILVDAVIDGSYMKYLKGD